MAFSTALVFVSSTSFTIVILINSMVSRHKNGSLTNKKALTFGIIRLVGCYLNTGIRKDNRTIAGESSGSKRRSAFEIFQFLLIMVFQGCNLYQFLDKRSNGYKARMSAIMKKPDTALQMIRSALDAGISVKYTLMDIWFTNEPFIKNILSEWLDVIGMPALNQYVIFLLNSKYNSGSLD